ncbi:MAG TPA: HAD-IC family P-type ATPase, partial [Candidatus Eisenbacteria bacterium]|nr:HAD-IC family P-type ATPase [Candidatus Eisenbacteria bacterium]
VIGPLQDAVFGLILVANTAIGLVQEARAKVVLDRLSLLAAPTARVLRQGREEAVRPDDVAAGETLRLGRGDQVVVDGQVLDGDGLEVDESALTGESRPVPKRAGDGLLSGSAVLAGSGTYRATMVGDQTFVARLTAEARRYRPATSELRTGINRILVTIGFVIPPLAVLLIVTQLRTLPVLTDALRGSVAGLVTLVPEGLVLLTSVAFAAAVVRLGRRQVLVQELAAVETLARVDVVCLDKTGTLTDGESALEAVELLDGDGSARDALAALAAAPEPNATARAIAEARRAPEGWSARASMPFSSDRGWSAADFGERGTWALGAPELLGDERACARASELAASGGRVLVLSRLPSLPTGPAAPRGGRPAALVVLQERMRPGVGEILRYFAEQGVSLRLLSGDGAETVRAVARRAGLDPHAARGRVTPESKKAEVAGLRAEGHVVAMVGDGVNDVPALREADLGVTLGSASQAARAVAQVVLLDSAFAGLPSVLAEGRRVAGNIERLAALFTTKTVYAALLILVTGIAVLPFPFLPRHLTLIGALTIGIPSFFLALAPNRRRSRRGFLRRTLLVSAPAGLLAALATFLVYALALEDPEVPVREAQTIATLVLAAIGLWVLVVLIRPLTRARRALVAALAAGLACAAALPQARAFFALEPPAPLVWFAGVGVVAATGLLIEAAARPLSAAMGDAPDRPSAGG